MDMISQQIHDLLDDSVKLSRATQRLEPSVFSLRFWGRGRSAIGLHLIAQSARDSLNHVTTLVGYFEGYRVRGELQLQIEQQFPPLVNPSLSETLQRVHQCMQCFQNELQRLLERDNFELSNNGPRHPGVGRTLELATIHVQRLASQLVKLVEQMARENSSLQQRAIELGEELQCLFSR